MNAPTPTASPMHPKFSQWYSTVEMEEDQQRRSVRWQGVSAIIGSATKETIETLARLAFSARMAPSANSTQTVRQAFKDADDTFEMTDNAHELKLLAAVSLVAAMDSDLAVAPIAALICSTSSFSSVRQPGLPMDLGALAEEAIARLSVRARTRPDVKSLLMASDLPKVDFATPAAKVKDEPNWENVYAAFTAAATNMRSVLNTLAQRQSKTFESVSSYMQMQDEELQMLWWLTGQYSKTFNKRFSEVPEASKPFAFASELAGHTTVVPGPKSVVSLMERAGIEKETQGTLKDAINSMPPEWLAKQVEGRTVSTLSTPIHLAIQRQLETGAGDAWVAGWNAATDIDGTLSMHALTLAELFYRERLLILLGDA